MNGNNNRQIVLWKPEDCKITISMEYLTLDTDDLGSWLMVEPMLEESFKIIDRYEGNFFKESVCDSLVEISSFVVLREKMENLIVQIDAREAEYEEAIGCPLVDYVSRIQDEN